MTAGHSQLVDKYHPDTCHRASMSIVMNLMTLLQQPHFKGKYCIAGISGQEC
jgi:hypothetical protein